MYQVTVLLLVGIWLAFLSGFNGLDLYEYGCTANSDCPGVAKCLTAGCLGISCLCPEGYMPNEDYKECFKIIELGERCDAPDSTCRLPYARCSDGKCECKAGFIRALDNKRCKKRSFSFSSGIALLGEKCDSQLLCNEGNTMICDKDVCSCKTGYRKSNAADQSAYPDNGECISADYELGTDITQYLHMCLNLTEGSIKDIGDECHADTNCPGNATCQQVGCNRKCACEVGFAPSNDRQNCFELMPLNGACSVYTVCETLHSRCSDIVKDGLCICDFGYEETGSLCRKTSNFPNIVKYATINETCDRNIARVTVKCQSDLECVANVCQCDGIIFREASVLERIAFNPEGYCVPVAASISPNISTHDIICSKVDIQSSVSVTTVEFMVPSSTSVPESIISSSTSVAEPMISSSTPVAELMVSSSTPVAELMVSSSTHVAELTVSSSTPVAEPMDTSSTPVAEPMISSSTPVAEPMVTSSMPVAEPMISSSTPVAEYMVSSSTPVAEPIVSSSTPVAEPMISLSTPVVEPMISSSTPAAEPMISSSTPVAEPMVTSSMPMAEPMISSSTPVAEPMVSPSTPVAEPMVSSSTPVAEPMVSSSTHVATPMVSSSTPVAEPMISSSTRVAELMISSSTPAAEHMISSSTPVSEPMVTSSMPVAEPMVTSSMPVAEPMVTSSMPVAEPIVTSSMPVAEPMVTSSMPVAEPMISSSTPVAEPIVSTAVATPVPTVDLISSTINNGAPAVESTSSLAVTSSFAIQPSQTQQVLVSSTTPVSATAPSPTTTASTPTITKVGIYDSCEDATTCPDNAECQEFSCSGKRCFCKSGFFAANKDTECLRGVTLGEACNVTITCSVPFSQCHNEKCVCGLPMDRKTPDGFCSNDLPSVGEPCSDYCHGQASCHVDNKTCVCDAGYRKATKEEVYAADKLWYLNGRCINVALHDVPNECAPALIGDTCSTDNMCPKNSTCLDAVADGVGCSATKMCWCDIQFAPSSNKTACLPVVKIGEICTRETTRCITPVSRCIDGRCECIPGFTRAANGTACKPQDYPEYSIVIPVLGEQCDNRRKRCVMKREQECINDVCTCRDGYRKAEYKDLVAEYYDMAQCRKNNSTPGDRPQLKCSDPPIPQVANIPDIGGINSAKNQLILTVIVPVAVVLAAVIATVYSVMRWRRNRMSVKHDSDSTIESETGSEIDFRLPRPQFSSSLFRGDRNWADTQTAYDSPTCSQRLS